MQIRIQFVCNSRKLGYPMRKLQVRRASSGSHQEDVQFIVLAITSET